MKDKQLWEKYCKSCNVDINTPYDSWQFGGRSNSLGRLVSKGIKTATSSGYDFYEIDKEELPAVGNYSIILDSKNNAICIIKTTKVYVKKFIDVEKEHAYKEGEGDLSLKYWRKVHEKFFIEECKEYGLEFNEDFKVVCEEFECVFSAEKIHSKAANSIIVGVSLLGSILAAGSIYHLNYITVNPAKTGFLIENGMDSFLNDGELRGRILESHGMMGLLAGDRFSYCDDFDSTVKKALQNVDFTFVETGSLDEIDDTFAMCSDHLSSYFMDNYTRVAVVKDILKYQPLNNVVYFYSCSTEDGEKIHSAIKSIMFGNFDEIINEGGK